MTTETIIEMGKIHDECREIGIMKNADYGENIDSIKIVGLLGLSTRLIDKACRIFSLVQPRNVQRIIDESIEDTLKDIINYATYGICLIRKKWNNTEKKSVIRDTKFTNNMVSERPPFSADEG